jgi:hypothetical protein
MQKITEMASMSNDLLALCSRTPMTGMSKPRYVLRKENRRIEVGGDIKIGVILTQWHRDDSRNPASMVDILWI